jgi:hypothetical protein
LEWLIAGLWKFWFVDKGDDMKAELTEEQLTEMGKMWGDWFLSHRTVDDLLKHFSREEVLSRFKPVERLAGLKPQEINEILEFIQNQKR